MGLSCGCWDRFRFLKDLYWLWVGDGVSLEVVWVVRSFRWRWGICGGDCVVGSGDEVVFVRMDVEKVGLRVVGLW